MNLNCLYLIVALLLAIVNPNDGRRLRRLFRDEEYRNPPRIPSGRLAKEWKSPPFIGLTIRLSGTGLGFGRPTLTLNCSGILIAKDLVLTSAYCVRYPIISRMLASPSEAHPEKNGINVVKACWTEKNNSVVSPPWDLSVIRLEKPVDFSETVYPAWLPEKKIEPDEEVPTLGVRFTQWGRGGATKDNLDEVPVKLTNCSTAEDHEPRICFTNFKGDVCLGDTGSPVLARVDNHLRVFGVASYTPFADKKPGVECLPGKKFDSPHADVYRQVDHVLDLIRSISNRGNKTQNKVNCRSFGLDGIFYG